MIFSAKICVKIFYTIAGLFFCSLKVSAEYNAIRDTHDLRCGLANIRGERDCVVNVGMLPKNRGRWNVLWDETIARRHHNGSSYEPIDND